MAKLKWTKVRHDRDLRVEHEGGVWQVDAAEWHRADGKRELRVYRIHGDINHPHLGEALQLEADSRGITLSTKEVAL